MGISPLISVVLTLKEIFIYIRFLQYLLFPVSNSLFGHQAK